MERLEDQIAWYDRKSMANQRTNRVLRLSKLLADLDYRDRYQALTGSSLWECPACHRGRMIVIGEIPPGSIPAITDTS